MTAAFALVAAAASNAGPVRQDNEEPAYSGRWLFAVADGLGGQAADASATPLSSAAFEYPWGREWVTRSTCWVRASARPPRLGAASFITGDGVSISSWGDQPHAVVFPDEWRGAMPVRIENAYRVSFGH